MDDKKFMIPDIQVDKDKFDAVLRKIASTEPLPYKKAIKPKPSPPAETEGPGFSDDQI